MAVYTLRTPRNKRFLTRDELLNALVSVPDAPSERWFNKDLGRLTRPELEMEQSKLRLRFTMENTPNWWLKERLAAVEQELSGLPV